jgi:iron(III) transport system substrate-binding protein
MRKKKYAGMIAGAVIAAMTASMLGGCAVRSSDTASAAASSAASGTASAAASASAGAASSAASAGTSSDASGNAASASSGTDSSATSGELTVYTALEDDQVQQYLASFYKEYPDIKLNVVRDSTGTIVAKAIAEKDSPVADVFWGTSASVMLQLDKYNLIKGYSPKGIDRILDKFKDTKNADAKWVGNDAYETAFLVNTDVCKADGLDVPTSFADLLKDEYKGQIVMPDPTSSGTGTLTVNGILQIMGDTKGWDYLTKLNDNIMSYTTSGSKPAKMAAAGECAIGISFGYRCAELLQEGNPVQVVFPSEGCGWDVEANCLVNKSTISPAAYTFLDWAISDEAMAEYATEYGIIGTGAVKNVPEGYSADPMSNLCDLDIEKAAEDRDSILAKFTPFLAGKEASS